MIELREVRESDLDILYEFQGDPVASEMAAFPSRDRETYYAHTLRNLANPTGVLRTITVDGDVAGDIGSWLAGEQRLVGYWIGRPFWRQGVATAALLAFVSELAERPLYAWVATSNLASTRVLEKAGFVPTGDPIVGEDGVEERLFILR
ncbi:MAG: GNAT family N-acetyltransferase [Candidatus Limnocylindrales bacterium]